ncbi:MAG: hypothetical protein JWL70_3228 [Acidimicrobiia bacterium]|nr:hypothetical protein [Acidimicrobiia bacterium]
MTRRLLALFGALAVAATACSGGKSVASPTTGSAAPAPSTSAEPTTAATSAPSTTAVPHGPVAPLTGLASADAGIANRPALVVKIDNHEDARPQTGLNQADMVVEELVEGISRFAAVFQSQQPPGSTEVGPVRSARTSDIPILSIFGTPLFAWSGANGYTASAVQHARIVDVGFDANSGQFYRQKGRPAPHNLFTTTQALFSHARFGQQPPKPVFAYRIGGVATGTAGMAAANGVKLTFEGKQALWQWDAASKLWLRSEGEGGRVTPHRDSTGQQVSANNVVVLFTPYRTSPADPISPEAVTVGQGEAWVFVGGQLIQGHWTRGSGDAPWALTDSSGAVIALDPGRTWIELPRAGHATFVAGGVDPNSVGYPGR